jgi:glycosyltransferase involved in cell wall biosynthesis
MSFYQPFVSILINNYNYGLFLKQAIDSALGQTWRHSEIIMVDDGSTDDSREIISSYGESIVPVLQENRGQAAAFNAGFLASRGDILCFLDSDDVFLPGKVESMVNAWRRNQDAGLIYHQLLFIDKEGRQIGNRWPSSVLHGSLNARAERSGGWWPVPTTSALACSRAYLQKVLPIPCDPYRLCADAYIVGLAPFVTPVVGVSESLAMYRIHGANNHQAARDSKESFRRKMKRCEVEFEQLQMALPRFVTSVPALSLEDHFPYQLYRWKIGGPVTKRKVLITAWRTSSMPLAMKCKEMLKIGVATSLQ